MQKATPHNVRRLTASRFENKPTVLYFTVIKTNQMKNLFAVLFFFACIAPSFSQELWLNETDDFTGDIKRGTVSQVIGDNAEEKKYLQISISFGAMRIADTRAFVLRASSDLGCSGASGNYAMLKFSDGEVIKLTDGADIDCGDMAQSTFLVNDELLARIEAKDAPVMIRLKQSEYYTDAKTVDAEIWNAHWAAVAK